MNKNKIYKPGECMKYMHVEVHPTLNAEWYFGDVWREVTTAGARIDIDSNICDKSLVLWSRDVPATLENREGVVQLTPPKERCTKALYVQSVENVAQHVAQCSLAKHVASVRDLVACSITLVIFGVKDYLKTSKRRSRTQNSNKVALDEIELEMAITDLLVSENCDTVIVNTPNELALLILQFTKAIAEAPHKKAKRDCDEQVEFYMRGDNKQCVAVDKDGNGMSRLWQQMVAILPTSSLETSRSLCAQYKSPLALFQAMQTPNAVNDIADIGVARAAVPGVKARRLGPEFSRKLQIFFTADDGDSLVD